jgi:hypothetical protein
MLLKHGALCTNHQPLPTSRRFHHRDLSSPALGGPRTAIAQLLQTHQLPSRVTYLSGTCSLRTHPSATPRNTATTPSHKMSRLTRATYRTSYTSPHHHTPCPLVLAMGAKWSGRGAQHEPLRARVDSEGVKVRTRASKTARRRRWSIQEEARPGQMLQIAGWCMVHGAMRWAKQVTTAAARQHTITPPSSLRTTCVAELWSAELWGARQLSTATASSSATPAEGVEPWPWSTASIQRARTPPSSWYTSRQQLDVEERRVFSRSWQVRESRLSTTRSLTWARVSVSGGASSFGVCVCPTLAPVQPYSSLAQISNRDLGFRLDG